MLMYTIASPTASHSGKPLQVTCTPQFANMNRYEKEKAWRRVVATWNPFVSDLLWGVACSLMWYCLPLFVSTVLFNFWLYVWLPLRGWNILRSFKVLVPWPFERRPEDRPHGLKLEDFLIGGQCLFVVVGIILPSLKYNAAVWGWAGALHVLDGAEQRIEWFIDFAVRG